MSTSRLIHDEPADPDPRHSGDIPADGLPNDRTGVSPPPSIVEWSARIAAVSLFTVLLVYLVFLGLRESVPPQFEIRLDFDAVEQRGPDWVLPLVVENTSTESVTELTLGVEHRPEASDVVSRTTTVYILGEGEVKRLEMMFPERPDPTRTQAHVHSYQSP